MNSALEAASLGPTGGSYLALAEGLGRRLALPRAEVDLALDVALRTALTVALPFGLDPAESERAVDLLRTDQQARLAALMGSALARAGPRSWLRLRAPGSRASEELIETVVCSLAATLRRRRAQVREALHATVAEDLGEWRGRARMLQLLAAPQGGE